MQQAVERGAREGEPTVAATAHSLCQPGSPALIPFTSLRARLDHRRCPQAWMGVSAMRRGSTLSGAAHVWHRSSFAFFPSSGSTASETPTSFPDTARRVLDRKYTPKSNARNRIPEASVTCTRAKQYSYRPKRAATPGSIIRTISTEDGLAHTQ
eukprot:3409659-Rhodomonas_salina.1